MTRIAGYMSHPLKAEAAAGAGAVAGVAVGAVARSTQRHSFN